MPVAVTWVPVLLPFLGRMDLWEGNPNVVPPVPGLRQFNFIGGTVTPPPPSQLKDIVCPDDTPGRPSAGLSYVLNVGLYDLTYQSCQLRVPRHVYTEACGISIAGSVDSTSLANNGDRIWSLPRRFAQSYAVRRRLSGAPEADLAVKRQFACGHTDDLGVYLCLRPIGYARQLHLEQRYLHANVEQLGSIQHQRGGAA